MRRVTLVAVVVVAMVALIPAALAGGGGHGGTCRAFSEGSEVAMFDSCFAGTTQFAPPGTVTAVNAGGLPHTFTAVDGSFDSGQVPPGGSFEVELEPGVYRVFCTLHGTAEGDGMAGVVLVGEPTPEQIAAAGVIADASRGLDQRMAAVLDQAAQLQTAVDRQGGLLATMSGRVDRLADAAERRLEAPATEAAAGPVAETAPAAAAEPSTAAAPPATQPVVVVPGAGSGDLALALAAVALGALAALLAVGMALSLRTRQSPGRPVLDRG